MINRLIDIFINRMYFALEKVNNQSPFFGAIVILTILINLIIINLVSIITITNNTHIIIGYEKGIFFSIIVFSILYYFKRKNENKIINLKLENKKVINIYVFSILIIFLIIFVKFANINRERIFKNRIPNDIPQKESLEGRIRKWWNE